MKFNSELEKVEWCDCFKRVAESMSSKPGIASFGICNIATLVADGYLEELRERDK